MATQDDPMFEGLLEFLKQERGFDFTGYKRASLVRRVQHRMSELGVDDLEVYHDRLVVDPQEFTALFNTILINVTGFFRDPEAWQYLRDVVVPGILAKRDGGPIRAWCAACASGEEAFTLAMVLAELLGLEQFATRVKIYATDVDEEALAVARRASYTDREIQGVPEEIRERYFERQAQRWTFRKELRRSVIFGRNDLVQDAPISHVDVLTCRNALMYFNADTQAKVLQRLHFALQPDGVLFLGKAEMLLSHSGLFRPLELKGRFFAKVPTDRRDGLVLPTRPDPAIVDGAEGVARLRQAALTSSPNAEIVIDGDGRLAVSTSRASYLFGLTGRDIGRPIQDLEVSYRPAELRQHIDRAIEERRSVWIRDVTWVRGVGEPLSFDIQVQPLNDDRGGLLGTSVIFNDVTPYRQLQRELEFSNRQLQTAYEELQATNEELQSMNEELHVSGEAQREQQEQAARLNTFMASVLGSMDAGISVVDEDLRVMTWNAKAEDLWGIRPDEAEGEHLFNLDIGLPLESLRPVLKRQLAGEAQERDVLTLAAVNRRGRSIQVKVTVARLNSDGGAPTGALLVMDVVPAR